MYCLENLDEIPAAREEIEEAEKEGIRLHTRYGPKRVVGQDGKVTGIELVRCSRVFDENRRFNPQFIEGSEETVDCDTVVLAIGQAADLSWIRPGGQSEGDARAARCRPIRRRWPLRARMSLPAATWPSARESSSPPWPKASARRAPSPNT